LHCGLHAWCVVDDRGKWVFDVNVSFHKRSRIFEFAIHGKTNIKHALMKCEEKLQTVMFSLSCLLWYCSTNKQNIKTYIYCYMKNDSAFYILYLHIHKQVIIVVILVSYFDTLIYYLIN